MPSKPLSLDGAENFSDVFAMKNRAHAGHLFRRGCVEFRDLAVGDRRLDRNGIEQPGKMEVGCIHAPAPLTFSGPSTRGVVCADRRRRRGFLCHWHVRYSLGGLRREFQGVDETAFGQFHFEAILALRFCIAQRRLRRFSENGFVAGWSVNSRFGLCRPPGLCAHATERDRERASFFRPPP